jgi:hypothetical protein
MGLTKDLGSIPRAITVDSSNNVGVGITSPLTKLHVVGESILTSNIFTDGDIAIGTSNKGLILSKFNVGGKYAISTNTSQNLLINSSSAGFENVLLYSAGLERMRITSGGNVTIGTTSVNGNSGLTIIPVNGASFAQLSIVGNNASGSNAGLYLEAPGANGCGMFYDRNAGLLRVWSGTATNGVSLAQFGTSWSSYSDIRLKTDLVPIENALNKIENLRSFTGRYITDDEGKSRSFLIAQDVLEVFPEAVSKSEDEIETLSLSYTELIPLLVASIQELTARLEILENK